MSKPRTGIAERLAVRLFAENRGLRFAQRRDGSAWAAASDADREEFRTLARVAIHFLAECEGRGPVTSKACEAARNEAGPAATRATGPV